MENNEPNFSFDYDGEDFTVQVGNESLRGCYWIPQNRVVEFLVIYVHDIGSFGSQNHDVYDAINQRGGAVFVCDHLGHGRSPGPRLALTIHDITKEISAMITYAISTYKNVPVYLYGPAAGALAILAFILEKSQNHEHVSGVVLEAPWVGAWEQREIGVFETTFLLLMNKIMPNYIFDLKFTRYTNETFKRFIDMSEKCPLYFPYMTPKFYISAMQTITNVRARYETWPNNIRLHVACARDDTVFISTQVIEFMNGIKRAVKAADGKIYNSGHLITKGRERERFLQDIINFFTQNQKKK
ncbi:hypothetical protein TVAG_077180 [Trichomonas vaginalis G3]|uniref:Serine aminopeptidase S33 domain-containing protein n=1 Tax=Trichomonas vaginalis (strain ATCC PRA-98 / G3) TaxID=412133 RepID=A2D9W5_TRIV3|nr:phospholipase-related family [Trichomonas vaginalis G3]EAY22971.1 hypothetical protein TVAG_077180 [Trichomonas vaginalis G3]KAI5527277.1 phospholipase-related family [Trichomonas vaginalis G3]|eukprot:XP_001583957.1 hypothetical protein [Trichomonas vaginalis G3]